MGRMLLKDLARWGFIHLGVSESLSGSVAHPLESEWNQVENEEAGCQNIANHDLIVLNNLRVDHLHHIVHLRTI